MSLYRPVTVSLAWPPSMVSVKAMAVNAVVFDTSTAYESTPTLSLTAVQLTRKSITLVSWPAAGCDSAAWFTIVSVTNPRVAEYGPPFARSSTARTRQ